MRRSNPTAFLLLLLSASLPSAGCGPGGTPPSAPPGKAAEKPKQSNPVPTGQAKGSPDDGKIDQTSMDGFVALAFSPDGKYLAIVSNWREVRLWRRDDGKVQSLFAFNDTAPYTVAFSQDSRRLAVAHGAQVLVFDTATGNKLHDVGLPVEADYLRLHPEDPDLVLATDWSGDKVVAFDMKQNRPRLTYHLEGYAVYDFSLDGNILWTMEDGRLAGLNSLAPPPSPRRPEGGRPGLPQVGTDWFFVTQEARSPDLMLLAVNASNKYNQPWTFEIYNVKKGSYEGAFHVNVLNSMCFSWDDDLFFTDGGQKLQLWDAASNTPRAELKRPAKDPDHNLGMNCVLADFSPDGRELATAWSDGSVHLLPVPDEVHAPFNLPNKP